MVQIEKNPEEDMKWYVRDDIEMIKHIHQIIQTNKIKFKNFNKIISFNKL